MGARKAKGRKVKESGSGENRGRRDGGKNVEEEKEEVKVKEE